MLRWGTSPEAESPSPAEPVTRSVPAPRAARRTRAVEHDTSMETAARQAGVLSQASREVAETSREAAESLGELRAAITDIAESTSRASAVADAAASDAQAVDARIGALQTSADQITEIVQLITTISQQSKILALNAYVEAARAGEVGRGFAVVADEVKQLAGRTARAAQDIAGQIDAVQQETREAVVAIARISGTLGSIVEAQDAIAAAVEQQRGAAERVVGNVERAASGSARITEAVAELADSQRLVYVRRALTVAQEMLDDAGGAALGDTLRPVDVQDPATGATSTVQLPDLLVGDEPLDRDADPRRRSAFVDDVVARIGGSCTLFQRLDDAGSMVRAATTVVTPAGRRNIGTVIARTGADGSVNPVLAAVLDGRTYTGPATVADRPYFTAYSGVHAPTGELIGVLYVGLPLDALDG